MSMTFRNTTSKSEYFNIYTNWLWWVYNERSVHYTKEKQNGNEDNDQWTHKAVTYRLYRFQEIYINVINVVTCCKIYKKKNPIVLILYKSIYSTYIYTVRVSYKDIMYVNLVIANNDNNNNTNNDVENPARFWENIVKIR